MAEHGELTGTRILLPASGGEARRGIGKRVRALRWEQRGATNILAELARQTREQDENGARARDRQVDPVREVEEVPGSASAEFDR